MANFFHYQNRAVRDLAYSCFGPSLVSKPPETTDIKHCHLQLDSQREQWLASLDQKPKALFDKLATVSSTRLGIYFEALWQFFIDADPALELIAANHPVRKNGKTLGEFDLIYYCNDSQQHYHLELAVKFYLGLINCDTGRQDSWWGPNCKDRLDLKLKRLYEHQCPLSGTEQGIKEIASLGCSSINREMAIKGMLFYPSGNNKQPTGIDSQHQRGSWYRLEQFMKMEGSLRRWKMLSRSDWLSSYYQLTNNNLVDYKTLLEQLECYFEINERPLMVCSLLEREDGFYEEHRYFITSNQWPGSVCAS